MEGKGESKLEPNQDYQKKTNEEFQIKKSGPLRCKSTKFHNDRYVYKTQECLELHNKLHSQE